MGWTSAAVASLVISASAAAGDYTVLPAEADRVPPKQMMHAYLMRCVTKALDRRAAAYEKLKLPDQLAAYQKRMRKTFVDALGGFPRRTPLNARVVGKEKRDGYDIEKVVFESQPRHFVTAILYLPRTKPPYPGVLVPCGHSGNGKAAAAYQQVSILLATNGLAALCYDPIDQGERYQLLDASGKPIVGGTTAHCLVGVGSTLLGRNTATYRVWDGMRAIDYLQSRPDVDASRIGCTGNSGGGTLTSYLMALDERIGCAAPSCYLTSLRRLCETIGPQDAEQNIHGQIARGLDHAEYVNIRAARPTLICAATGDFFDIDGTWDTFRQAKRFYTRLGFAERVSLIETDARHGFSKRLREGAVRWMRRWLLGADDAIVEGDLAVVADDRLRCTPRGQVMLLEGARSTYEINVELEQRLAKARRAFWRGTDCSEALRRVRQITGIRPLADLPRPKCAAVGTIAGEKRRIEKLILEPEPGIRLPALAFVPARRGEEACLYLHAEGKQAHAAPGGPVDKLVAAGRLVLAVDLRGMGETASAAARKRGISKYVGGDWKQLYLAYLLARPYLTMRAEDALVCGRFLAGYKAGKKPNRVHLVALGKAAPAALHAAALEPELFATVSLTNCLVSWSNVIHTPMAVEQFENVIHGALRTYDLPDLLGTLPAGRVTWTDPVNALGQPASR